MKLNSAVTCILAALAVNGAPLDEPEKVVGLSETAEVECKIHDYWRPESYEKNKPILHKIIYDETFRNESALKLQGAIRIDTHVDDNAPAKVEDDFGYWSRFDDFEQYLRDTYSLFYDKTTLHKVNYHGLVYIWEGSDKSLKPLILMAHQDVVTVSNDTLDKWPYPPFDGHYDGTYMYGRGTADCKGLLIGLLTSAEELMKTGFAPKRTVIYSFGFDEEIMGNRNKNAEFIEQVYGKDSIFAIIDEGGLSIKDFDDVTLAVPATAEKGYIDLKVRIETPGGHSSIPPEHTGIGIMGLLIAQMESVQFPTYFTEENPAYSEWVCLAEHSKTLSKELKWDILHASNPLANHRVRHYLGSQRNVSYAIKTTQALDIIDGGSKSNSLPEDVVLTINNRIAMEETPKDVVDKYIKDCLVIAKRFKLGLSVAIKDLVEEEILSATDSGKITITSDSYFNRSPITPIDDTRWKLLAGNIRHIYEETCGMEGPIIVSPGISSGNTDTKWYWNLTDHIYRYRPGEIPGVLSGEHGIREYIKYDSHLQIIAFYFEYIQSADELGNE